MVTYVYIGSTVQSFSLLSIPRRKSYSALPLETFSCFLSNNICHPILTPYLSNSGGLYIHNNEAIRLFRQSRHVYSHTLLGWTTWAISDFISLSVALITAWFTRGITEFFLASWRILSRRWVEGSEEAVRRNNFGHFCYNCGDYRLCCQELTFSLQ